jgi:hypothetical protein
VETSTISSWKSCHVSSPALLYTSTTSFCPSSTDDWGLDEFRFWSEQYLLQAFLTFNSEFEVMMANRYLAHRYREDLKAAFPNLENLQPALPNPVKWGGGSFWMRRKQRIDSITQKK